MATSQPPQERTALQAPSDPDWPADPDCPRGGGHGRRGCGHGRRARMFDNGDLRLLIMTLLAEKPRHGYELIKALELRVGAGYSPSPGVIYPTLTLLEELGQAAVIEARAGRRLYALTASGQAALAPNRPVVEAILARLAAAPAGPPPRLTGALEHLAAAVRLRLQGRSATATEIETMAAAIDDAARVVEAA